MPVQSIECLLTQAQIKRYLAGAEFSDELLAPLEIHLKACPDCMAEANRQRELLGGAPLEVAHAIVSGGSKPSPFSKLKGLFASKAPPADPIPPVGENPYKDPISALRSPKNLVMSAALAVVLVLMSTSMRNPTSMLGPRASEKITVASKTGDTKEEHVTEQAVKTHTTNDEKAAEKTEPETHEEDPIAKVEESHGETKPTAKVVEHATEKKPVTHTTNDPPKVTEPATKREPEVGGTVLVADSAAPKPVKKAPAHPVVSHPKATKLRPRPARKRVRKARPTNHIRVYLPNGSVKPQH